MLNLQDVMFDTLFSEVKMPRGPKKHLKRLNAPKAWMLDKLGGVFAIKTSSGPHKMSESLPIAVFLRLGFSTARPAPRSGYNRWSSIGSLTA